MSKTIIISGADKGYADLLGGLLGSIETRARDAGIDIGVLDLGLEAPLSTSLKERGIAAITPDWDYPLDVFRLKPPNIFKAMTARPHLRRHFPGYDMYLWLDADTWVQDWTAIELYMDAAGRSGFAATPEADRSYDAYFNTGSVFDWRFNCFRTCFDEETARQLAPFPIVNCGVFASRADAPHWDAWSRTLGKCLEKLGEAFFFAEQTALNEIIRRSGCRTAFLPSTCNWMCNRALPLCSPDGAVLIEPNPPFNRIGIVHMTADTKHGQKKLRDVNGHSHFRSLRFDGHADTVAALNVNLTHTGQWNTF